MPGRKFLKTEKFDRQPKSTTILVVDDNLEILQLMKVILEGAGFRVRTAKNGSEGLAAAQADPPDLLITDGLMPGMDGFGLVRRWREDPQLVNVPIILYTGTYTGSQDELFSYQLGVARFLRKPAENRELLAAVMGALGQVGGLSNEPEALAERDYLQQHNEALLRKLEDKISELEASNRSLNREVEQRRRTDEVLKRRLRQDQVLLEIGRVADGELDEIRLLQAMAAAFGQVMPFECLTVVLFRCPQGRMEEIAFHRDSSDPSVRTELFRPEDAEAVKRLPPYVLSSEADEAAIRWFRDRHHVESASFVGAPMRVHDQPIGTICVATSTSGSYAAEDAVFLVQVALSLALRLDGLWKYHEIAGLTAQLKRENVQLKQVIDANRVRAYVVGDSEPIRKVVEAVRSVAGTNATVLILGETGAGKGLMARAIHDLSERRDGSFIEVNCAALAPSLIESELFGHEKGSFTGASARRFGRFELADKGTIFLDEIGDLPLDLQAKLLRVLEDRRFERVGGTKTIEVDVRVIAATNRHLAAAVRAGRFREDLYYRLNVFPIQLPPLRDRKDDIPDLSAHLLKEMSPQLGKPLSGLSAAALRLLKTHDWPGNVRELSHVLERAAIVARGPIIDAADLSLPPALERNEDLASSLEEVPARLDDVERNHICSVLASVGWVIDGPNGAAIILGLHPNTLRYRLRKLGISRP